MTKWSVECAQSQLNIFIIFCSRHTSKEPHKTGVLTTFYPEANGWRGLQRQHPAISGSISLTATKMCVLNCRHTIGGGISNLLATSFCRKQRQYKQRSQWWVWDRENKIHSSGDLRQRATELPYPCMHIEKVLTRFSGFVPSGAESTVWSDNDRRSPDHKNTSTNKLKMVHKHDPV